MKQRPPHSRRPARGRTRDDEVKNGIRRGRARRFALRVDRQLARGSVYDMFDADGDMQHFVVCITNGKAWAGMEKF